MPRPPIVFIPGFPGSDLLDESNDKLFLDRRLSSSATRQRLRGPNPVAVDGVVPGDPLEAIATIAGIPIGPKAITLYHVLARFGYQPRTSQFRPVGWDWRLPVDAASTLDRVEHALTRQITGGPALMIVHSTGGLVLRALLPTRPQLVPNIGHVLSLGVPWAGTLTSFEYLTGKVGLSPIITKAEVQELICHAWAAYDLLPLPPAAPGSPPVFFDDQGMDTTPLAATAWVPSHNPALKQQCLDRITAAVALQAHTSKAFPASIPVTNVAGWGYPHQEAEMNASGDVTFWRRSDLDEGAQADETVPHASASWLEAPPAPVPARPCGRSMSRSG